MPNFPPKVTSFSHKPQGGKGKFHPDVGGHLETVSKTGGKSGTVKPPALAAKSSVPKGVVRGDGTDNRGTKVVHKQEKRSPKFPASNSPFKPSGVRGGNGLTTPKKVK